MPVSRDRLTYIRELANDERVHSIDTSAFGRADWQRFHDELVTETIEFCRTNSIAEELHAFIVEWNWDKGVWGPEEILANPVCEAATALLIYWSCCPEFYLQYANREEVPDFAANTFELLSEVETRYVAGEFPVGMIAFDPADPEGAGPRFSLVGLYNDLRDKFVRALPPLMYVPVQPAP